MVESIFKFNLRLSHNFLFIKTHRLVSLLRKSCFLTGTDCLLHEKRPTTAVGSRGLFVSGYGILQAEWSVSCKHI